MAFEDELQGRTLGRWLSEKAAKNGDRLFLHHLPDDARFSYNDANRISNRLANGLSDAGFGPGQHIAVMSENRPEVYFSFFGVAKAGGVTVPINTQAKGYFLRHFLDQSDSCAIILEPEFLDTLAEVIDDLPKLETVILLSHFGDANATLDVPQQLMSRRVFRFDALLDASDETIDRGSATDLAQIMYTSGTTGPSKGNMWCHTALLNWARQVSTALELGPDDIYLVVFPLFHGAAWMTASLTILWRDGALALERKFSASGFFESARRSGATAGLIIGVGSFLAKQPPSPGDRDHRLKLLMGGPPPPQPVAFEERFGLKLAAGFGLTDFGVSHMFGTDADSGKIGSAGTLLPDWDVRIVDDNDIEVPVGEPGEITMRTTTPNGSASGYYKLPEATLASRRNLWFHTGDIGRIDEDGYLHFIDRKKDAIRRRGENISSLELEMIISRHPEIAASAVFPVKAEGEEDEVAVALIRQPGAELGESDFIRFCEKEMPRFAVPRYVRFLEDFPRTASAKTEKHKLRSETESMLDDVWDREREAARIG